MFKILLIGLQILLYSVLSVSSSAQTDSVLISNNFQFEDGIYKSVESFQNNQPDYTWEEVEITMHLNDESLIATINKLMILEDSSEYSLEKLWGISFEGLPYVTFDNDQADFIQLAGLRQVGKICYFSYWKTETEMVPIKAYNPVTGRPFRQGNVAKEKEVLKEWILNFTTGEIAPFNVGYFWNWAEGDTLIQEQILRLPSQGAMDQLFKYLKLYNQSNFIKIASH